MKLIVIIIGFPSVTDEMTRVEMAASPELVSDSSSLNEMTRCHIRYNHSTAKTCIPKLESKFKNMGCLDVGHTYFG